MPAAAASRYRRWWLWPAGLALLVALYALGGFFGVPKLVDKIARDQVAALGRQLVLGEVAFNPFTFEARIRGLKLTEADGAPIAAFEELYVDAGVVRSVTERGIVLLAVRLTGPDVSVVVDKDGSINLAKLVPPSKEPKPPEPAGPPPKVIVGDLAIERGRVGIEDRSRPQPFKTELTPIEFHVQDFRTSLQHENDVTFSASASTGETLEWTGAFTVQPIGSKGRFSLTKLQASTLVAYLQDQLPVRLVGGTAELSGDYQLALDPDLKLDVHLPAVTVRGVALAEPGAASAKPLVSLGELGVHEVRVSLAKREVGIERVELRQLRAIAVRERNGALNLARLYAPAPASKAKPAAKPASPPAKADDAGPAWRVAVGKIDLADANAQVEDRSVEPAVHLDLKGLGATLTGFNGDLAAPLHLQASLGIGATGRASAQGELRLQPVSVRMDVDVRDLDAAVAQPYLTPHTGLVLRSAIAAAKGAVSFAQPKEGPAQIQFKGEAGVAKLKLEDRASGEPLLGWNALKVSGIDFRSAPQQLAIERIDLTEPNARIEISEKREINIANAMKAPGAPPPVQAPKAAAATPAPPEAAPMPIRIGTIHIEKARVRFSDRSIQPNFSAGIFDLGGDLTRYSTDPKARMKIQLQGKVDQFSPVVIGGELAPAEYARDTDVTMSFRNMDLVRFNPYSGRFAGYNIVKGKLTTELHYRIRDRALQAEHHVVLDQLEFGDATGSKDAVPLPIKLAVSLLKDRHGVIDLSLPVSGSLDDPSFRIGPVIWTVVKNALSKAVTAPFSALASLIGGGGEELAYVEFAPGAADLSDTEAQKLDKLSHALVERPQVKLDVPLAFVDEDNAALARRELDRRVPVSLPNAKPEDAEKDRREALERVFKEVLGHSPDYPKMDGEGPKGEGRDALRIRWLEASILPGLKPGPEDIQRLAARRARTVQATLLKNQEIQAERIFLTSENTGKLAGGNVRLKMSLR